MPMRIGTSLPSLQGATIWLNSTVDSDQLVGKPLLVHFWSVSCYLCKNNYPTITEWKKLYPGLQVVAIHMPRQPEDTDIKAVEEAAKALSLTEPCAVDNAHEIKNSFENTEGWVPAYFLFDDQGKLKMRAAGENGLTMLKGAVHRLFPQENSVQIGS